MSTTTVVAVYVMRLMLSNGLVVETVSDPSTCALAAMAVGLGNSTLVDENDASLGKIDKIECGPRNQGSELHR